MTMVSSQNNQFHDRKIGQVIYFQILKLAYTSKQTDYIFSYISKCASIMFLINRVWQQTGSRHHVSTGQFECWKTKY